MIGLLETNERKALIPELAEFTFGQPNNLLSLLPRDHAIRIENSAIPAVYALKVIQYCELSAWVENPALIIQLLKRWEHLPEVNAAIRRLLAAKPMKFYIDNRVWDSFLLALNLPFLNRKNTRLAIEGFSYALEEGLDPAGSRVLVVKGPDKSGKSYTFDYIRYVNSVFANLNFNTIWIDFKKQIVNRLGPAELVESLLDQLNQNWREEVSLPVLDAQQSARWMQELVSVLLSQIWTYSRHGAANAHMIILLDGFDNTKVPRDTIDLIQLLAAVAVGKQLVTENSDMIRLVLLGFSETVSNFRNRVKIDDIKPIDRADLEEYIRNYAQYKEKVLPPAVLKEVVDSIGIEHMPQTEERTAKIAKSALMIAQGIFEEVTIAEGAAELE